MGFSDYEIDFSDGQIVLRERVNPICKQTPVLKQPPNTHIDIRKIVYDPPYTTVYWADGTFTRVKCGKDETFNKYNGFIAAVAKKIYGSTSAVKKICDRCDIETINANLRNEKEEQERANQAKRIKRDKKIIKRMARRIYLENEAKALAEKMAKKE